MMNNKDRDYSFITKFFWFCSGANIKVLKEVGSEQSKYNNQGFAIFIIGIVGALTGGYAISTVFSSRLVIYVGGALWGVILSSIDRAMISTFNKKTNTSIKEKIGGAISLIVKLGISTIISLSVAKPLEVKIFESSIDAQIAKNIEKEISISNQENEKRYQLDINQLEKEKEREVQRLNKIEQQLKQSKDAYQQELIQGGYGRGKGYGSVAKQLEQSVNKAQQQYNRQENIIREKEDKIANLKLKQEEQFKEIGQKVKEEQTATDFVARLHVLHQIQEEEAKIFLGFGVYETTGWVISLLFILIDTYPVINKIFSPIDNYEKLLEKYQQQEDEYTELVLQEESELKKEELKRENELTRKTDRATFTNELGLIQNKSDREKSQKKRKIEVEDNLYHQSIDDIESFLQSYFKKARVLGLRDNDRANSLDRLYKVRKKFFQAYSKVSQNRLFSLEELNLNSWAQNQTNRSRSIQENSNLSPKKDISQKKNTFSKANTSSKKKDSKLKRNNSLTLLSHKPLKNKQKKNKLKPKKESKIINFLAKSCGFILTPVTLWVVAETALVSQIKLSPIPYPQEVSPHLVYTRDDREIRNPKSWKTSSQELDLKEFSPYLQNALIASEDRRFYKHNGFDIKGTARAFLQTLRGNTQGGSTISQQIAKKLFLEERKNQLNSIQRKIQSIRKKTQQIILAIRLEFIYDKEEILETYLNRIYLGHQKGRPLIGFEEASQFYFGKSAQDINISESATLVAILPSPNSYNPINNKNKTKKMRDLRIQQMLDLDMITQEEAEFSLNSEIVVTTISRNYPDTIAPHAYDRVIKELDIILDKNLSRSGQFIIETTLNSNFQQAAKQTLKSQLDIISTPQGYNEGALVTIDNSTGAILALVGGEGTNYPLDYATKVRLPLASTFKLIPYTVAISEGISPNDKLSCTDWQGKDDYTISGCSKDNKDITVAESLAASENTPALRLAEKVGLKKIEQLSKILGLDLKLADVKDNQGYHQQLVLGTYGSTAIDITNAYAAIANLGGLNQPYIIKTIRDRNNCSDPEQFESCKVVYSVDTPQSKSVVNPEIAQEVTKMLRGVVTNGTATKALKNHAPELISNYNTIGKTGTSLGSQNLWFIGSIPEKNLTTGVWLGQSCIDEPRTQKSCPSTRGNSSLSVAWWAKYIKEILSY